MHEKQEIQQQTQQKIDTRHRGWVFTVNNPKQTEKDFYEYLKTLYNVRYFVFAKEQGDKEETPHYQGYIEFSEPKYFSKMKNDFSEPLITPSAHIEARRGTKKQARDYVKKIGEYADKAHTQVGEAYEFGNLPAENGERSDLEDIMLMIEDGATLKEIKAAYPSQYFRYYRNISFLFNEFMAEKFCDIDRGIKVHYVWGAPRIGKSRAIDRLHGRKAYYRTNKYKNPFDKYNYEQVLILDEYDSQLELTYLNNLLDSLPCQVECRWVDKWAAWDTVYMVSNLPFEKQYPFEHAEKRAALKSRLNNIIHFTSEASLTPLKATGTDGQIYVPAKKLTHAELVPLSDDEAGLLPF